MILAVCRVPESLSAGEVEAIKARARTLDEDAPERFGFAAEDVLNAEEDALWEAEVAWEESGLPEAEVERKRATLHRALVAKHLDEAVDALLVPLIPVDKEERERREAYLPPDTIKHELAGSHHLMTGAPTWGDPPTASYYAVALLDASGLLGGLCEAEDAARAPEGTAGHGE